MRLSLHDFRKLCEKVLEPTLSESHLRRVAPIATQLASSRQIQHSLWQTLGPGSILSAIDSMQQTVYRDQLAQANLSCAIVVLGYWRSGTTLLHELLCLDKRYTYPTTHACMNPHHFLFSEASALAREGVSAQRPMDEMEVRPASPQEDEFALLGLGARSPYEALIFPQVLPEALKLTDPTDLSADEAKRWREVFVSFLKGVSVRGAGKPIILKSPTHGARVATLRKLLPDARYILIVRDPITNFESVVRMWRKMFETYALGPIPPDDEIREAVLMDRPQFEAKLAPATNDLPANRFATLTYEALARDPLASVARLYDTLELGDFNLVRDKVGKEIGRRRGYQAKSALPSDAWQARIHMEWAPILAQHNMIASR